MLHLTCACTLHVVKKAITTQAHHAVTSSDRLGTAALPTKLFLVSGLDGEGGHSIRCMRLCSHEKKNTVRMDEGPKGTIVFHDISSETNHWTDDIPPARSHQ